MGLITEILHAQVNYQIEQEVSTAQRFMGQRFDMDDNDQSRDFFTLLEAVNQSSADRLQRLYIRSAQIVLDKAL